MAKQKSTTEIYIKISKGKGKTKDTVQHTAETKKEAISFINKYVLDI